MADNILTGDQIADMGLNDWRTVGKTLQGRFDTPDFSAGLEFVTQVAAVAEAANHHPDLELHYSFVKVALISHDVDGLTNRDVDLAGQISQVAAGLDLTSRPGTLSVLEIGLDTWDAAEIAPFWRAVLDAEGEEEIPLDESGAALWFQNTDEHPEPRQRFHLDLWVPPEVVDARIEAAVAAGGTLVSDQQAPAFWVLADPQGNKVCLCTHRSRSD